MEYGFWCNLYWKYKLPYKFTHFNSSGSLMQERFWDSLRCLTISMIVLIALLSSFFVKNVLISEKILVLSCLGIGCSIIGLATSNILIFRRF